MKKWSMLFACLALYFAGSAQQVRIPAPSPTEYVKQDFGLSFIELSYSRPGVKGRQIFGDLVPYGKVWRTGANNATTITFGDDVTVGDAKIPAGKYGLLSIPGESEWTIIISKQLNVTNPADYRQDQDVARISAKSDELPFSLENFSILFNNITGNTCDLQLIWDKTFVSVPIKTDIDQRIMTEIDNAINKDNRPYFSAAMYYLENGKDLNKALEWFNKATDQNPDAYFMFYQKARCLAKMGRRQEAIATAQQSMQLSKKANNSDYVTLNEKLIASLK